MKRILSLLLTILLMLASVSVFAEEKTNEAIEEYVFMYELDHISSTEISNGTYTFKASSNSFEIRDINNNIVEKFISTKSGKTSASDFWFINSEGKEAKLHIENSNGKKIEIPREDYSALAVAMDTKFTVDVNGHSYSFEAKTQQFRQPKSEIPDPYTGIWEHEDYSISIDNTCIKVLNTKTDESKIYQLLSRYSNITQSRTIEYPNKLISLEVGEPYEDRLVRWVALGSNSRYYLNLSLNTINSNKLTIQTDILDIPNINLVKTGEKVVLPYLGTKPSRPDPNPTWDETVHVAGRCDDMVAPEGNAVNIIWDKGKFDFDTPGQIIDGRTLVPLRELLETFEFDVNWNAETSTAEITKRGTEIYISPGSDKVKITNTASHDGHYDVVLDVPAQVVDGRLLVPLRFVSNLAGVTVYWDNLSKTVALEGAASMFADLSLFEEFKTTPE